MIVAPPTPERLHARALRYLERYATTAAHLRRVLLRRAAREAEALGLDTARVRADVDAVIARVVAAGLVDDRQFALRNTAKAIEGELTTVSAEFKLDGVQAGGRVAIVLGDKPASIGFVAADRITHLPQNAFDRFRDRRDAARAIAVAEHHVGAWALVLGSGGGWHGMAIHQHGRAKFAPRLGWIQAHNLMRRAHWP